MQNGVVNRLQRKNTWMMMALRLIDESRKPSQRNGDTMFSILADMISSVEIVQMVRT